MELRLLAGLPKDPDSVSSTDMAANIHLEVMVQDMLCTLVTSSGSVQMQDVNIHVGKIILTHKLTNFF